MTLKEKFENIEFSFPADESEKIANDFTIGFAYWITDSNNIKTKDISIEELLEIYKKEKGL